MLVTMAVSPFTMLVESSRPPKPTSTTASRAGVPEDEERGGHQKVEPGRVAADVLVSAPPRRRQRFIERRASEASSSSLPCTLTRSVTRSTCGEA